MVASQNIVNIIPEEGYLWNDVDAEAEEEYVVSPELELKQDPWSVLLILLFLQIRFGALNLHLAFQFFVNWVLGVPTVHHAKWSVWLVIYSGI